MSGHLSGSPTQILPSTLDPWAGPRGWGAPGEMACDGGGRPGRESKQCQRLMSGNRPGAEGLGRGTAIAHPDRPAGRGWGAGNQRGGEHESRQRVPWRPDPLQRQTDGQRKGSRPPSPAVAQGDLTVPSSLPSSDLAAPPTRRLCRTKGPGRGLLLGPPHCMLGSRNLGPSPHLASVSPSLQRGGGQGCSGPPILTFHASPLPVVSPSCPQGPHPSRQSSPNRCLQQA